MLTWEAEGESHCQQLWALNRVGGSCTVPWHRNDPGVSAPAHSTLTPAAQEEFSFFFKLFWESKSYRFLSWFSLWFIIKMIDYVSKCRGTFNFGTDESSFPIHGDGTELSVFWSPGLPGEQELWQLPLLRSS